MRLRSSIAACILRQVSRHQRKSKHPPSLSSLRSLSPKFQSVAAREGGETMLRCSHGRRPLKLATVSAWNVAHWIVSTLIT